MTFQPARFSRNDLDGENDISSHRTQQQVANASTALASDGAGFASLTWRSGQLELYARDYPAASGPARPPIVCLHGLTRNSKDFSELATWLAARGHRVIVPDIRGRGLSQYDPDPMNYLPVHYARDVISLLDSLGTNRAIFIGTSMGGIVTMIIAAKRPPLVAAAVLNDVGPEASPVGLARIASYAGKKTDIGTWQEATAYVRSVNEVAFPGRDEPFWKRFAERTFRLDEAGDLRLDYDPDISVPIKAGRLRVRPILAWWMFNRLARRRPTMLVRGELSDIVSPRIAARMKARARRLVTAEIPNVGHAPFLTEPESLSSIETFLNGAY
jgi:pimeloyl-ACP methyl ester carboxylesterase